MKFFKTEPGLHVGEEVLELGQPDTGHGHELPHNGKVAVAWGDCLATVELHLIFVFAFGFWGDCLVVVELQQEVKTCSLYSCCGCVALKAPPTHLSPSCFDLLQFSLSAVKSLCPMFLRICQGYSNIISFRHNFKRLLAFFDLTYETKSVLSVEDVCDGIPDTIVTARSMPYQGLNSAPKMGQPSKSVFLFPIC